MEHKCHICGRTIDKKDMVIRNGEIHFCSFLCFGIFGNQKRERELKLKLNLQQLEERGEIVCQR